MERELQQLDFGRHFRPKTHLRKFVKNHSNNFPVLQIQLLLVSNCNCWTINKVYNKALMLGRAGYIYIYIYIYGSDARTLRHLLVWLGWSHSEDLDGEYERCC